MIDDLAYGEFSGYLEAPTLDLVFQVRTADNTAIVAAYQAPLATLGLEGAALTVVASGFLDPENNNDGPAFGLWVATAAGGALLELPAAPLPAPARVQVIHNSADDAAAEVDLYLNGEPLLSGLAFRTATPFVNAPSGVDLSLAVAPANSNSVDDAVASFTLNLEEAKTYIVVANGIVVPAGYDPATPFDLYIFDAGRETAAGDGTDVLVFHGATDAPVVDVFERGVLGMTAVDDLAYGEFAGYLELPTANLTLDVRTADGLVTVASYSAPLAGLGLEGQALTVLASGFLDPANNNDGPAFGLWVALADGGPLVELPPAPEPTGEARVQVIHNSADAAVAEVDVYVNGELALDDFAFRTASPFISLPSGVDINVAIAPANSTNVLDAIVTFTYGLEADGTYILVANGIVSPTGHEPAMAFDIHVFAGARENAAGEGTDILVFHGATDAPTVDVAELALLDGALIVEDLGYGEFAGYLEVDTEDYILQVRTTDGTPVAAYRAPLASLGLEGTAITVLASGFLDPANNSDGAAFGLWVALADGGELVELPFEPIPTGEAHVQVIHNSADALAAVVDIYVNGELLLDDLAFRTASPFTPLPSGIDLEVAVAPAGSTGPEDAVATFGFELEADMAYILVANGIVSPTGYEPPTPFDILVHAGARATAAGAGTDILVFHGATDAPTVDVGELAVLGGSTIVDDLGYGEFSGYLEVGTEDYILEVRTSDGQPLLAYAAPLATLGLDGAAITVLASGFLDPSNNSNGAGFGLWVALADGGGLVPLSNVTSVNERDALLNGMAVWPNPASDRFLIELDSKESAQATLLLTDVSGRTVQSGTLSIPAGTSRVELPVEGIADGAYTLSIMSASGARAMPVLIVR